MSRLRNTRFDVYGNAAGPEIKGTEFDPRVERERINRYTKSQLRSHIDRLNSFIDRRTQFVGADDQSPITMDRWGLYKALESQRNDIVRQMRGNRDALIIGNTNTTVAERRKAMQDAANLRQRNPAVNPEEILDRKPYSLANAKAVDRAIEAMRKKLDPDYDAQRMRDAMGQFVDMMDRVDNEELKNAVIDLSPEQFDVLWNDTAFVTALGHIYEMMTMQAKEKPTRDELEHMQGRISGQMESAMGLAQWAKGLKL